MGRTRADERGWNMCPIGLPVGIGAVYHVPLFFLFCCMTQKKETERLAHARTRARACWQRRKKTAEKTGKRKKSVSRKERNKGARAIRSAPPPRSRNLPAGQCIFWGCAAFFLLRVLVIHCLGSRHAMAVPRLIGEKKGNPRRGPRGGGGKRDTKRPCSARKRKGKRQERKAQRLSLRCVRATSLLDGEKKRATKS